jgi:predicted secreted protein
MADTGLTGADAQAAATANRKKIIKYVIIAAVIVGVWFIAKKLLKK